jgi:DNA polymerase
LICSFGCHKKSNYVSIKRNVFIHFLSYIVKYKAIKIPITYMRELTNYIKYFVESGVDSFFENEPGKALPIQASPKMERVMKSNTQNDNSTKSSRELADSAKTLPELESTVRTFTGCDLKKTAKNTVFADGTQGAKIMFIGEAPGANEDAKGIPFCGQSGKLLDNIIRSIGLKRSDVYITNTVFWRPPANRRPTPEEIKICRPFVEKHIELINPELIVLVGSTAVESLLASQISMHELRHGFYDYTNCYLNHSIKTAVIFHPSYLLRQPYKKKLMWYDIYRLSHSIDII